MWLEEGRGLSGRACRRGRGSGGAWLQGRCGRRELWLGRWIVGGQTPCLAEVICLFGCLCARMFKQRRNVWRKQNFVSYAIVGNFGPSLLLLLLLLLSSAAAVVCCRCRLLLLLLVLVLLLLLLLLVVAVGRNKYSDPVQAAPGKGVGGWGGGGGVGGLRISLLF